MLKPLQIAKERGWELGGDGGTFFDFGVPIVVGSDIKVLAATTNGSSLN